MEEQQANIEQKPTAEDEIDFIALAKKLWDGRKTIIICTAVGLVLGVFVALTSPKEYTASSVMVPQLGEGSTKLGGLSGLASMAGFNLNLSPQSSELSPTVYPEIVSSVPFQLELMYSKFNFSDISEPITLIDYYTKYKKKPNILSTIKKYTIGLPILILNAIKGEPKELKLPGNATNQPLVLNEDQFFVRKQLIQILSLDVNPKEGILTLTSRMPEALVAAQVTEKAQELLQKKITEFKIEKAHDNLNFIQERFNETKKEFEKAQYNLTLITDRNKDFTSGLPLIEKDRAQTQYTISYSVFQDLAKQLEQAKIQVKKETPIFTIIKPVNVPFEKTKPKKIQILATWVFLGGAIGVGVIFFKQYIKSFKQKLLHTNK